MIVMRNGGEIFNYSNGDTNNLENNADGYCVTEIAVEKFAFYQMDSKL